MRKLLLLALLLYDVILIASRDGNFDYDEFEGAKRHSYLDDRQSWRKKSMLKSIDNMATGQKEWEPERRRHDYDPRYFEDMEMRNIAREPDYRRHYDEVDKSRARPDVDGGGAKSAEQLQTVDKDSKRLASSCDRPHERYESCFSGCAAVTCDNPRDRLRPCYPFCEPGCVCIHPYVRDDRTHKCVLPDDCTKGLKGIPDIGDE